MSYAQHMKHWHNHRKDRFCQETYIAPSCSCHEKTYKINTKEDGEYYVYAWHLEQARERFQKEAPELIILSVEEVKEK